MKQQNNPLLFNLEGVVERINEINNELTRRFSDEKKEKLKTEQAILRKVAALLNQAILIRDGINPASLPAKKSAKVNRSAISGKFVTEADAKQHPDTTIKQTVKRKRNGTGCS